MSQVEELKSFVAARLQVAASEILTVVLKTLSNYEEEATRLKEENRRHSSLLEIILKKKLPKKKACHATNSATAKLAATAAAHPSTNPADEDSAAGSSAPKSSGGFKIAKPVFSAIGHHTVFTSKQHFLKFSTGDDCLFCFKQVTATEQHLMRRHYDIAVHYVKDGMEKFVIPCMCSAHLKDRSHWHCPCCKTVVYRRCNLETHLLLKHDYTLLTPNQVKGIHDQPFNISHEEEPSSLEDWYQEELASLEQEEETASLLLQIKEKAKKGKRIKVEDVQHVGNRQPEQCSLHQNQAQDPGKDFCLDAYKKVIIMEDGTTRPVETPPDSGAVKVLESAGKMQPPTLISVVPKSDPGESQAASSSLEDLSPPSKKQTRNRRTCLKLNTVKKESFASQNRMGSYYCKACGEIFHYMHKLKIHVQKHSGDKIRICGICGKSLEHSESLHEHLQNHDKKNICGICGKQFSRESRLRQHKSFHRPKTLR